MLRFVVTDKILAVAQEFSHHAYFSVEKLRDPASPPDASGLATGPYPRLTRPRGRASWRDIAPARTARKRLAQASPFRLCARSWDCANDLSLIRGMLYY